MEDKQITSESSDFVEQVFMDKIKEKNNMARHTHILSAELNHKILYEWNNTKSSYDWQLLHQIFEQQVAKNPDSIAITFEDIQLSFYELNAKANQLANYIKQFNVGSKSCIAICLPPSAELLVALLAALKSGNAYVPLDPSYPVSRLQFMLEDTNAAAILTQKNLLNLFDANLTKPVICIDTDAEKIRSQQTANLPATNDVHDIACIIYTSGSTGKPKGVKVLHRNLCCFNHWFSHATAVSKHDVYDFSSSISFDFSIATTIFPLLNGAQVAICPEESRKDPYLYIKHLLDTKVTTIKITPSHFKQFKESVSEEYDFPHLHTIVFGGEALFKEDIHDWLVRFPKQKIINEYGPTETSVATSWIAVTAKNIAELGTAIPIGKPAFNTQLYILNRHLQPVAINEVGEMYIGGDGVTDGYLNRPELTKERFVKDLFTQTKPARLYKTGDLCKFLKDGNIEFVGRVDHQIKIRGYRIEINEIEKYIASHPLVKDSVVVAQEDGTNRDDKHLVAYCVAQNINSVPSKREMHQFLKQQLPEYMIPAFFVMLDAFPLTPNGKLDRKALPEATAITHHHDLAPRTDLEAQLVTIWSQVLNIKQISIDDNFFELGGHSLSAARIISKIRRELHKEIKLIDFYHAATIIELAKLIEKTPEVKPVHAKNHAEAIEKFPLNDLQLMLWLSQKIYLKKNAMNIIARRRVAGKIDAVRLKHALQHLIDQHDILKFHISTFLPVQKLQKHVAAPLETRDLQSQSKDVIETTLINSLNELQQTITWAKGSPLIRVRLFTIDDHTSEIQICLAHIVSDEISSEIVFANLAKYYDNPGFECGKDQIFINSVIQEVYDAERNLDRDIGFWQSYLTDVSPYAFPTTEILNGKQLNKSTSVYLEIPEASLRQLQNKCSKNQISMPNALCAAVGITLSQHVDKKPSEKSKTLAFNFVKSTRDNDSYLDAVGFFIRPYMIKMQIEDNKDIFTLAKEVQNSSAVTAPYQPCSIIVKLASLFQSGWKNKFLRTKIVNSFARILAIPLQKFHLNEKILSLYGKIFLAVKKDTFLVQINLLNNFIPNADINKNQLFGYDLERPQDFKEEKILSDNILDIAFSKGADNKSYVTLSSNISDKFLTSLGQNIIHNIESIAVQDK